MMKLLENKIISLEIHNRKSNLLFYGINQNEGENVYKVLKDAFATLGVDDAPMIAIANAHRLSGRPDQPAWTRPHHCAVLLHGIQERHTSCIRQPAEEPHEGNRLSRQGPTPIAAYRKNGSLAFLEDSSSSPSHRSLQDAQRKRAVDENLR